MYQWYWTGQWGDTDSDWADKGKPFWKNMGIPDIGQLQDPQNRFWNTDVGWSCDRAQGYAETFVVFYPW